MNIYWYLTNNCDGERVCDDTNVAGVASQVSGLDVSEDKLCGSGVEVLDVDALESA